MWIADRERERSACCWVVVYVDDVAGVVEDEEVCVGVWGWWGGPVAVVGFCVLGALAFAVGRGVVDACYHGEGVAAGALAYAEVV